MIGTKLDFISYRITGRIDRRKTGNIYKISYDMLKTHIGKDGKKVNKKFFLSMILLNKILF